MKKIILLVIVFIIVHCTLIIENCHSQWVQMSNGMDTLTVYALASSGNNIIAGASNGTSDSSGVYLSTNNAASWTQTGLHNKMVFSLLIVGNNIFAGTWRDGVYLSTNNGMNWIQSGLNGGSIYCLAINGNNIFAGTQDSGVYISTNSETNWTRTTLNNKTIKSIVIQDNNVFAGSEWNGVYKSTNNGVNWTQTPLDNIVHSMLVNGNNIFAGTSHGVYISTNSGTSWVHTILDTNLIVFSLVNRANNIIAGTIMGVYLSTNNGTNWIAINEGLFPIAFNYSLLILNNYIFTGTYISLYRRPLSEIIGIQNISTEIPSSYSLSQNYPNPFNPTTKIKFDVPRQRSESRRGGGIKGVEISTQNVTLKVYNILGKEIATLVNEKLQPGTYEVTFDGNNLNTGVYFYRLTTDNFTETKKMLLIK